MSRTSDRFFETTEFHRLNQIWQGKLKESGFKDLEDTFPVAHKRDLKATTFMDREVVRRGELSGLAEHYRRAGRWYWERVWPRRVRKLVWGMYAEGIPRRELCVRMGTAPGHEPWYIGAMLQQERKLMELWYLDGADGQDQAELSLLDEELANNGDFAHVVTRGEGGGRSE